MPRLATSEENKLSSNSESQYTQEQNTDAEAGRKEIDIIRTEVRRKYKGKTPSQELYLRTHQKLADLKNDIKRAARLWTEKAKENIQRNLNMNKVEFIPYSVLYESQHEALYKYWMETLTEKHKNEIRFLTVKLHALAGIEEKNIVPEPQEGEKENKQKQKIEKPITKPVQEKPKTGRLLNKRRSLNDIELRNQFQPLASQGESTVETDMETDDQNRGMDANEAAKKKTKKEKRERQKAVTRNTKENPEPSNMESQVQERSPEIRTETKESGTQKRTEKKGSKEKTMPPIIVEGKYDLGPNLRNQLKIDMEKEYTVKYGRYNTTLRTFTETDYNRLRGILRNSNVEFHSYTTPEEKVHSSIVRGLEHQPDEEDIRENRPK
ncbi:hypothetical protein JTB14_035945 [Gonioctena quinquepunctata]|nr:hypothetical protein JTB14_035945 [Gonioctena quinquepunctata]